MKYTGLGKQIYHTICFMGRLTLCLMIINSLWPNDGAWRHSSWASYQMREIAGCACAGNAGNVFPCRRFQRKPLVSDPGMHHGTCVTHVPWCMSGSLTCGDRENVPGIPGACAPAILRIWQEAHAQHWFREWPVAWEHQPRTRTNADLSLNAISQELVTNLFCRLCDADYQ